jgi:hypothetical protein
MAGVHAALMERQGYYANERSVLRAVIAQDLRTQGQGECGK